MRLILHNQNLISPTFVSPYYPIMNCPSHSLGAEKERSDLTGAMLQNQFLYAISTTVPFHWTWQSLIFRSRKRQPRSLPVMLTISFSVSFSSKTSILFIFRTPWNVFYSENNNNNKKCLPIVVFFAITVTFFYQLC